MEKKGIHEVYNATEKLTMDNLIARKGWKLKRKREIECNNNIKLK